MAITNQIASCCCDIKTQLASCCCDVKDAVTRGNYENQIATERQTNVLQSNLNAVNTGLERGFSNIGFETQKQTCDLQKTFNQGFQRIVDGQKAAEMREMQAIINRQGDEISTYKTAGLISQQLSPIQGMLGALKSEIDSVKCKLPETATVAYQPFTAVPNCVAWSYGLNNFGLNGFNQGNWA